MKTKRKKGCQSIFFFCLAIFFSISFTNLTAADSAAEFKVNKTCEFPEGDFESLRDNLINYAAEKLAAPAFTLSLGKNDERNQIVFGFRNEENSTCYIQVISASSISVKPPTPNQKSFAKSQFRNSVRDSIDMCEKKASSKWRYERKINTYIYDADQGIFLDTGVFVGCEKSVLSSLAVLHIKNDSGAFLATMIDGNFSIFRIGVK